MPKQPARILKERAVKGARGSVGRAGCAAGLLEIKIDRRYLCARLLGFFDPVVRRESAFPLGAGGHGVAQLFFALLDRAPDFRVEQGPNVAVVTLPVIFDAANILLG